MIPLDRLVPFKADRERPSPNHGERGANSVKLIILHATADNGNEIGAESWMNNPRSLVSAHLHIRRDGTITRHVPDARRAWHAGASKWPGVNDVNSYSLGWEIANRNDGKEPYTASQYLAVATLLRHYLPQGIDREDVLSHALIAPGRKTDPLGWDWSRMWDELDRMQHPRIKPRLAPIPPLAPPRAPVQQLDLEKIMVPTVHHVAEIARVRGLDREEALPGLKAAEVLLRAILAARVGGSMEVMKYTADALAEYIKKAA